MKETKKKLVNEEKYTKSQIVNSKIYISNRDLLNAVLEENEKEHHVRLSIKNIEYRNSKIDKTKIKESPHGFTNLKKQLNIWTENKINELNAIKTEKK